MKAIASLSVCALLISFVGFSQGGPDFTPKGSFSVDVGIPTKNRNAAFGRTMEGLLNAGVQYKYNVFNGLTVGAGFKHSYFNINTAALNNAAIGGGVHMPAFFASLSYERFSNDRVAFGLGLRAGYGWNLSVNDTCRAKLGGPYSVASGFVEPQFELLFLTEKNSPDGFSLVAGYGFYFFEYGPEFLCEKTLPNTVAEDYEGITRFFSIGFGYRHYFTKKKG